MGKKSPWTGQWNPTRVCRKRAFVLIVRSTAVAMNITTDTIKHIGPNNRPLSEVVYNLRFESPSLLPVTHP
jgi:hypothetical protein